MKIWRLKKTEERRFKQGHPWVFSNELQESPKGTELGEPIEVCDASGEFVARGFGNPHSLISFRAMSRDPSEKNPFSSEGILRRMEGALLWRKRQGLTQESFRWFYGEADGLPGLIVDLYLRDDQHEVVVVQAQTAGADRALGWVYDAIRSISKKQILGNRKGLTIVVRNEATVRTLEGLQVQEAQVIEGLSAAELDQSKIRMSSAVSAFGTATDAILFKTPLFSGQKTGFFLDQSQNIKMVAERLHRTELKGTIRILDLCCYVGQWSTQLARTVKQRDLRAEVTLLDASEKALEYARENVSRYAPKVEVIKADVFEALKTLPARGFDLVVCDPPALISGRKHLPEGKKAYFDLNLEAMTKVAPGGMMVSASCSALFSESDLESVLGRATIRTQTPLQWVARGGQAPDHPVLAEFPEGNYLKVWFGVDRGEPNNLDRGKA